MIKKNKGEEYLTKFPKFNKWINECLCCHRKGYNPNMPDRIGAHDESLGSYFIKKYFHPLSVNQDGLCEICKKHLNS